MFHSEGLGFIILLFFFEKNFNIHQSSLECQNVVFTNYLEITVYTQSYLLEPQNVIVELLLKCPFLVQHVGSKWDSTTFPVLASVPFPIC